MKIIYGTAVASLISLGIFGLLTRFDSFFFMCFVGIAVLSGAKILHQGDYHTKGRQVVHLVAGIKLVYLIKVFGMFVGLFASGLAVVVALVFSAAIVKNIEIPGVSHLVAKFERKNVRPMTGVIYYALGAFLTVLLFFNNQQAVFAGILAIAFIDSYATGFGTMFGRVEFIHGRSVEGILAGFIGCYLICSTFLPGPVAFTAAIVGTAIDVASLPVDDNLTIPLIVAATVVI